MLAPFVNPTLIAGATLQPLVRVAPGCMLCPDSPVYDIVVFIFGWGRVSVLHVRLTRLLISLTIGCSDASPIRNIGADFQFLFDSFPILISALISSLMLPPLLFWKFLLLYKNYTLYTYIQQYPPGL